MIIFASLSFFGVVTTLFLGLWIYSKAPTENLNRVMVLCLVCTWMSFAEFETRIAESIEMAKFWIRTASLWPLFFSLNLHFLLIFTNENKKLSKSLYFIIYIPAIILTIIDAISNLIVVSHDEIFLNKIRIKRTIELQ